MKLQQTVQCECRVSATLSDDGTLSAKVFASSPYNTKGGTATAEVPVPEALHTKLHGVMQEILNASETALGEQIGDAIHTARRAARALGEHEG